MKTFNLEYAAEFLKLNSERFRRLTANKKISAGKAGKWWCFLGKALVNYIRSLYDNPAKYRRVSLIIGEKKIGTL